MSRLLRLSADPTVGAAKHRAQCYTVLLEIVAGAGEHRNCRTIPLQAIAKVLAEWQLAGRIRIPWVVNSELTGKDKLGLQVSPLRRSKSSAPHEQ